MPIIRDRFPDVQLMILGEGPERSRLESLIEELQLNRSVTLPGTVPCPFPTVSAARIFCLPSRFEAFGLVLLEALAIGVPIIATDAPGGGPRLLLDDGRCGLLIPPNSSAALANAVVRAIEEPVETQKRMRHGLRHAEMFSPSRAAQQYVEVFHSLLASSDETIDARVSPSRL
jgi:glycosyltransferase involved in cell wall biosynthesis